METLSEQFRKNGLDYCLVNRNEHVALYELDYDGECVGWEVSRIYQQQASTFAGRNYREGEVLPSNEKFGPDGSKAFHADGKAKAELYFPILSDGLKTGKSLESIWKEAKEAFRHMQVPLKDRSCLKSSIQS
jgi:hypothetical protein